LLSVYGGDQPKRVSLEAASRPVKRHIWRGSESVKNIFRNFITVPRNLCDRRSKRPASGAWAARYRISPHERPPGVARWSSPLEIDRRVSERDTPVSSARIDRGPTAASQDSRKRHAARGWQGAALPRPPRPKKTGPETGPADNATIAVDVSRHSSRAVRDAWARRRCRRHRSTLPRPWPQACAPVRSSSRAPDASRHSFRPPSGSPP